MTQRFDFSEAIAEMDGGVFLEKVTRAVQDTALGVVNHGAVGKVVIELRLERIGDSRQVTCKHKVAFVKPTLHGKASEEDTTSTPFYVMPDGGLSVFPYEQMELPKLRKEEEATR